MLHQTFKAHLQKEFPFLLSNTSKIIIAISGGIDSVVLAHLFIKNNIEIELAHCNFKLRDAESQRDEDFVIDFAKNNNIKLHLTSFNTQKIAIDNKLSIQVAARNLRYNWFETLQQNANTTSSKTYLLTAHHANDNAETLLHNFFRGTGINGLTGIAALDFDRRIIRPLLPFFKEELLAYSIENKIDFVEDSSNQTDKYSRNFIRNALLPQIKNIFVDVDQNLQNNIIRICEAQQLFLQAIELHKKKLIATVNNQICISILKLKKSNPLATIIWEIFKQYNFNASQINEITKLLNANNGAYVVSKTHRVIKNRAWLLIDDIEIKTTNFYIINTQHETVNIDKYCINCKEELVGNFKNLTQPNSAMAVLDASKIKFPLVVRKPNTGDYFYPLGMLKKQKLSKFFINNKLSSIDKENVWVVEMDKKIIWVVGHRIDNRYKLMPNSKTAFIISRQTNS
jgi:tRNA(Ile)-lysidine synthase